MAVKLTRLTHNIAMQLRLVAESCTICSSRSKRPIRELLDTPSYVELQEYGLTLLLFLVSIVPVPFTPHRQFCFCVATVQLQVATKSVELKMWKAIGGDWSGRDQMELDGYHSTSVGTSTRFQRRISIDLQRM